MTKLIHKPILLIFILKHPCLSKYLICQFSVTYMFMSP